MWQRKGWLEKKTKENAPSRSIFSLQNKKQQTETETVKNSTIPAKHRKGKEKSLRREIVTVFFCGCDFTIACHKLQESGGDKEDHLHRKGNLLSVRFLHGPQKQGPEQKPWPDSTTYRVAPGNPAWCEVQPWEWQRNRSRQPEFRFQSCSTGLPGRQ